MYWVLGFGALTLIALWRIEGHLRGISRQLEALARILRPDLFRDD